MLQPAPIKHGESQNSRPFRDESVIEKYIEQAMQSVPTTASDNCKKRLRTLLNSCRDVFSSDHLDLGLARGTQHAADAGDASPIKQPPVRVPCHVLPHVQGEVTNLLEEPIVRQYVSAVNNFLADRNSYERVAFNEHRRQRLLFAVPFTNIVI